MNTLIRPQESESADVKPRRTVRRKASPPTKAVSAPATEEPRESRAETGPMAKTSAAEKSKKSPPEGKAKWEGKAKPKKSSVRHTRAIQRDRSKRPSVGPPDEQIQQRLEECLHPALYAQVAAFHDQGLRERTLTLPVMVAFLLSLLWRGFGSVGEAIRVLREEGMLWVAPLEVSPQAVRERLRTLPASLFERVWEEVLPSLHHRWKDRQRPIPPALAWAQERFTAVLALDGSTLDALVKKVGLLKECEKTPLAGRMAALVDVVTRLPWKVWYEEDSQAHDQRFWPRMLEAVQAGMLLIFDLGFLNYRHYEDLSEKKIFFLTRAAKDMVYRVERTLARDSHLRDQIVWVGSSKDSCCRTPLRLVQWKYGEVWYSYLTNVLDPQTLPAIYVVALYWQRWRIEDVFHVIKRLLGLAYFFGGSINAVQVQVWMTWLLYAVLVDLTDAVAAALHEPFQAISIEMVYRGLYHFTQAYHRGHAQDPVTYLAAKAKVLGIRKQTHQNRHSPAHLVHLKINSSIPVQFLENP